ncbi:MAG: MFS transporter [Chloroflexi bacterium]|nr:MFS transporter [Chloroflexota bacterium]
MSIALGDTRSTPLAADARDFIARRQRAITSAWAGFALDSYSIYLPNTALLPAMGYFQANLSPAESSLFVGMTFAATLLGRPVGAILFGSLADRLGRQRIGAITIYGFGTVTLLIGLLPGAELVGATLVRTADWTPLPRRNLPGRRIHGRDPDGH